jgi:hypothetical protein
MVQTNMGLRPVDYDIIDAVPQQQIVKKKIEVNGAWEDRQFIRIPVRHTELRARGTSELEEWCYKHYSNPKYLGNWFKVSGYIILDEQTYTHWKLCE